MASVEGSPLNLCERLTEARDDYVNALAMLFAKAEIVRITLRSCFNLGLDLDSPLRFIDNPTGMLGKVGQWFRSLNLVLEDLRSRERIVTVYRLMRAESVAIGGPSEKDFTAALNHLRNSKESSTTTDARLSFDMDALVRSCAPTIDSGAAVRVLAIGAAIATHRETDGIGPVPEQENAAFWERMRRERANSSFEAWIRPPALQLSEEGDIGPPVIVGDRAVFLAPLAWDDASKPASEMVRMESQSSLRNIPAWNTWVVVFANKVRTNDSTWPLADWEQRIGRSGTLRKDEVRDIVIGVTLGIIDPAPQLKTSKKKSSGG